MRTLVVGAGVAGLTLGGCVLHGLGSYGGLLERSVALERHELAAGSGRMLQALDMSVLAGTVGPVLMVSRRDLVSLLEAYCGPGICAGA